MLIAHLSDPHICPEGHLYQGLVDSNSMFTTAVAQLATLQPAPDVVIITGDLIDDGSPTTYAHAKKLLTAIQQPVLLIPGNHDNREAFRSAFADAGYLPTSGPLHFVADHVGPVRIVALDITLPDLHHGDFDEPAAAWLDATLAAAPQRPTLVMLHQPPFASGIPYIDQYACHNGPRLAAVLARHPQVERVVCGHIHRFMQLRFGGTLLCTAPSTTTAIALRLQPDAEEASYIEPPAMLLHHWKEDTGLITHWLPIGTFAGPLPFA